MVKVYCLTVTLLAWLSDQLTPTNSSVSSRPCFYFFRMVSECSLILSLLDNVPVSDSVKLIVGKLGIFIQLIPIKVIFAKPS